MTKSELIDAVVDLHAQLKMMHDSVKKLKAIVHKNDLDPLTVCGANASERYLITKLDELGRAIKNIATTEKSKLHTLIDSIEELSA